VIDVILANPIMRAGAPIFVRKSQVGGPTERRKLVRRWDEPKGTSNLLPWILLNPSMGDDSIDDPTILRMIHFTWAWGFDGLAVYNVYPFRTPSPKECAKTVIGWDKRQDWWVRDTIWENHRFIATELANIDAAIVAWGAPAEPLGFETVMWAERLFDTINDPDGPRANTLRTWCIGLTGGGHPKHPMARGVHRVPNDARPLRIENPGTIGIGEDVA
jgi:hypothetical protein